MYIFFFIISSILYRILIMLFLYTARNTDYFSI